MNLLDDIFCEFATGKSSKRHNFAGIYHTILDPIRFETRKVLEIGIFDITSENAGASLKSWAEHFSNVHIYGVDLHEYSFINTVMPFASEPAILRKR